MKASNDALLPVLIGIVGEGSYKNPKSRLRLQQTARELILELKNRYPSTPLHLLCCKRNELEECFYDAAMECAHDEWKLQQVTPALLGKYSQILIVVRSNPTQETERIIELRVGGKNSEAHFSELLHQSEKGPVWEVSCSTETPTIKKLYPQHPAAKDASHKYDMILKRMDGFNSDVKKFDSKKIPHLLLTEKDKAKLNSPLHRLLNQFEVCDQLAIYFQKRTYVYYFAIFLFSFLTVFFYDIYGTLIPTAPYRSELYCASLFLAFLTYLATFKQDYENKYFDYRALAEGMRVQFFWSLMDLERSVSDHYLHKTENELIWIRGALRAWHLKALENTEASNLSIKERLEITFQGWVTNQNHYFSRAGTRENKQWQFLKYSSSILLIFAGVFAVLRVFVKTQQGWILAATGLAPAIGALMKGYIQKRGLPEHVKQYGRMSELYLLAQKYYENLGTREDQYEDAMGLIQELGKEALAENSEWVLLHRERRVTFPKPK